MARLPRSFPLLAILTYFLNLIANFDEPFLYGSLLGALAQIRQLDCYLGKVATHHHLQTSIEGMINEFEIPHFQLTYLKIGLGATLDVG